MHCTWQVEYVDSKDVSEEWIEKEKKVCHTAARTHTHADSHPLHAHAHPRVSGPTLQLWRTVQIEAASEDLQGKPEQIIEKIVSGRVEKAVKAKLLMEQPCSRT